MSNVLAIAATTRTLRNLLLAQVPALDAELSDLEVTLQPPDVARKGISKAQLNLFLYQVVANAAWRNLGSRFANWVADRLLDKPKGIYLSSFRCMSDAAAKAISNYRGPYPYIDGLLMQVTQRIDSVEVAHLQRPTGRSNYSMRRLVRLWLNLATSFSLAPLRVATFAGAAMALAGGVSAVAVIAEALLVGTPSGWASVASPEPSSRAWSKGAESAFASSTTAFERSFWRCSATIDERPTCGSPAPCSSDRSTRR